MSLKLKIEIKTLNIELNFSLFSLHDYNDYSPNNLFSGIKFQNTTCAKFVAREKIHTPCTFLLSPLG